MRVGYRRVSSIDQSLDRQDLGECERVFEEKLSGGGLLELGLIMGKLPMQ